MIAAIEYTAAEREIIDHIVGQQKRFIRCVGLNPQLRTAVRREILHGISDAVRDVEMELDETTAD